MVAAETPSDLDPCGLELYGFRACTSMASHPTGSLRVALPNSQQRLARLPTQKWPTICLSGRAAAKRGESYNKNDFPLTKGQTCTRPVGPPSGSGRGSTSFRGSTSGHTDSRPIRVGSRASLCCEFGRATRRAYEVGSHTSSSLQAIEFQATRVQVIKGLSGYPKSGMEGQSIRTQVKSRT